MLFPRILLGVAALTAFGQPALAGTFSISCDCCSRRHNGCGECHNSCGAPHDCGRPQRHWCKPQAAPYATVVPTVPALMVAQQTVPVTQMAIAPQAIAPQYVTQAAPAVQYVAQAAPAQQYIAQAAPPVQYIAQSAPPSQYAAQAPDCGRRAEQGVGDCNERIDELEKRMLKLSKSVNRLVRVAEALEQREQNKAGETDG